MSARMVGRKVGGYVLGQMLGRGGMGEVYRAHDLRLGRDVAIKRVLDPARPNSRARLRREARVLARLSHATIVPILDILEEDDGDWLVMELVEGTRMDQLLSDGPIEPDKVADYGWQIASGLAESHAKGILHRDLKTENIIVTESAQIRILDFGLARSLVPMDGDSSLTNSGQVLGTIRAMSPEQARGLPIDERSDLFSLGVLLYELAVGESPFVDVTPTATLVNVCSYRQVSACKKNPRVSSALSELIDELLAKALEMRPESATEVAARLHALRVSSDAAEMSSSDSLEALEPAGEFTASVESAAASETVRRRRWRLGVFALVAIAAAVVIGGDRIENSDAAPLAVGDPAPVAMTFPGQQHVLYRSLDGDINHLWRSRSSRTNSWTNWTEQAVDAPPAAGDPATLVVSEELHVFYRDSTGDINHLRRDSSSSTIHWTNWTERAVGAPPAEGDPATMFVSAELHVFYRDSSGSICHLWQDGTSGAIHWNNWTRLAVGVSLAPSAAGEPATMAVAGEKHVFYRDFDDNIIHLWRADSSSRTIHWNNWTTQENAPLAAGDPATMTFVGHRVQLHVFYRNSFGHISHIWRDHTSAEFGTDNWTIRAGGAPLAAGDPATAAMGEQDLQHVFYRGESGDINHLWWGRPEYRVSWDNWTEKTAAPAAAGDPATMVVSKELHVFYRGFNGSINHLWWDGLSDNVYKDVWTGTL